MKKFTFILLAMFAMAFNAKAQYNVSGHKILDNWSIGLEGGVTSNLHDWDTPNGGVAGIQLTKGITPVFSLELAAWAGFNNAANWNLPHSHNVVDNVTAMVSGKVNLMNWFCGYNGKPRVFEIQLRGGMGYMNESFTSNDYASYPAGVETTTGASSVFKLGADFDFNVGAKRAWTISLRPAVVMKGRNGEATCDNMDLASAVGCKRYSHNAVGQLTAGVTYHFKNKSNDNHYFTRVEPATITNIVEKTVEKKVEKIVEKTVEKIVTSDQKGMYVVEFEFDKDELTPEAKAVLDGIVAKKANVVAYASGDGVKNEVNYNINLSNRRAQNVKKYLESKGIQVSQATGMGIVGGSKRWAVVSVEEQK